ncbi:MAG: SRPBCC domain-containing protein [Acidobacteriaceae bacterium]
MEELNHKSVRTNGATRRKMIVTAAAFGGFAACSLTAWGADDSGLTRSAETIHQEPVFDGSPTRIYQALTDAKEFDRVMRLSAAMRSMATGTAPAVISPEVGGAFSLFGGYVTGRQLELAKDSLIIQAWRSQGWKPDDYSIARFHLVEHATGTRIIFDHRGFPDGNGSHLAEGWKINYWEPLREYLNHQK